MKIMPGIYLVGAGMVGLSHSNDSYIYLLDGGGEPALIDAGVGLEIERILANIEEDGLDPTKINKVILTHAHADHAGGCKGMREKLRCKIFVPGDEVNLLERGTDEELGLIIAKESGIYSPDYLFPHCSTDVVVSNGDAIWVGELQLRAIHTPGHSPGSTCYLLEHRGKHILFTGDVVFYDGEIGLLNYRGSNLADYRSYINRLANLSVDVLLPGHKLFTLRDGQQHIDRAISALKKLSVPPTFI
ncbi:MBL fold metallo-hydrolase [Candidatus Aerophobetes bacterium]|nr:MBL fold metallo-hydrolase [Candidatus Aerophobetes bacterium]